MIHEPDFSTERELEDAVASAARELMRARGFEVVILRGFGLDLAIFAHKDLAPLVAFLEIKAFAAHHGRCGFGNQRGEGNQVRLLFDEMIQAPRDPEVLRLFSPTVRWVLGNRSSPVGSARFAFFTCEQAQAAAANGVKPGKQNNFRLSAFKDIWVSWPDLIEQIGDFLERAAMQRG
jgi:hypothetical protein